MWDYFPAVASSYAGDIDDAIKLVTYIVGGWAALAYLIFFYFLFRYRRREGVRSQYVPGTGKAALWVILPVFVIAVFDFGIDIINHRIWTDIKINMPETTQTVRVTARQWLWQFTYPGPDGKFDTPDDINTMNTLHAKLGAKTKFELRSADVLHSFSIPAFRLKQDIIPGRVITGWFEAIKEGNYDLQCAEICGLGHTNMGARAIVHSAENFEKALTAAANMEKPDQVAAANMGSVFGN